MEEYAARMEGSVANMPPVEFTEPLFVELTNGSWVKLGICSRCGAGVPEDSMDRHRNWHKLIKDNHAEDPQRENYSEG